MFFAVKALAIFQPSPGIPILLRGPASSNIPRNDPKRVPKVPSKNAFNMTPVSRNIFLKSAPNKSIGVASFRTNICRLTKWMDPSAGRTPILVRIAEISIAVTGPDKFLPNDVVLSNLNAVAADVAITA